MSEITLNRDDADAYVSIILFRSIAEKAKKLFSMEPNISIHKGTGTKDNPEYYVTLLLPEKKYLYYQDLMKLQAMGMRWESVRVYDNKMELRYLLDLDKYLVGLQEKRALLSHAPARNPPVSSLPESGQEKAPEDPKDKRQSIL